MPRNKLLNAKKPKKSLSCNMKKKKVIMELWASLIAQLVKNLLAMQETWFDSWVWKILWRRKWQPLQYSSLENPMDRGAWQAIVHGVARARHDLATKPPSWDCMKSCT